MAINVDSGNMTETRTQEPPGHTPCLVRLTITHVLLEHVCSSRDPEAEDSVGQLFLVHFERPKGLTR
jgi:hypothetical protein